MENKREVWINSYGNGSMCISSRFYDDSTLYHHKFTGGDRFYVQYPQYIGLESLFPLPEDKMELERFMRYDVSDIGLYVIIMSGLRVTAIHYPHVVSITTSIENDWERRNAKVVMSFIDNPVFITPPIMHKRVSLYSVYKKCRLI